MNLLKRIFAKFMIVATAAVLIAPCALAADATSNLPFTEIGDYGNWMNVDNILQFDSAIETDMKNFQPQSTQLVDDYVPIVAKAGLAMMNGLSMISDMLDSSLVRF